MNLEVVILTEAKDLRRYLGLNWSRMVFNEDLAVNQDSVREKDKVIGGSSLR